MSKIAVIYWSGTGNTAIMANEIAAGIGTDAEVFSVDAFHGNVADYDKIAFGCSAMGDEVLEEAEFEPFFTAVEGSLKGKKVALFGSYGWGGQSIGQVEDELKACGFEICLDKIRVNYIPKKEDLKAITEQVERLFD